MSEGSAFPSGVVTRIGESARVAGVARILTIVFSLVGTGACTAGGYAFSKFWESYQKQGEKLESISVFLAAAQERANERDRRLVNVESENRAQGQMLFDHERRIIRLESTKP